VEIDYDKAPYLVLWELTRACALACRHCRAEAMCHPDSNELTTDEAFKVLNDLREFGKPLIILTGGDPVQKKDLFAIIARARNLGFTVAITPSATPSTTQEVVQNLKQAGITRLAISLDGMNAADHDNFRGVVGSFDKTIEIINWAQEASLPVQINTTIFRENHASFEQFSDLISSINPILWSVFFLVPTGRATQELQISPGEAELVLRKMVHLSRTKNFDIKSTAAPQFRRVLLQKSNTNAPQDKALATAKDMEFPSQMRLGTLRAYQSVNDGKGLLFISHTGDIYPSGFLPLTAGNVRTNSPSKIYREHELFVKLRNSEALKGKCGRCRYRKLCGGSRARAYASHGDYLAEDPLCAYYEKDNVICA
jgi:radical SAM protein